MRLTNSSARVLGTVVGTETGVDADTRSIFTTAGEATGSVLVSEGRIVSAAAARGRRVGTVGAGAGVEDVVVLAGLTGVTTEERASEETGTDLPSWKSIFTFSRVTVTFCTSVARPGTFASIV
jgi:hypothetical protein